MIPNVLTIAGSDSSGGAGIQADLKTFAALGLYGASVITVVTAQNTRGVRAIHPVPADIVADQLQAVLDDIAIAAIKIGLAGGPEAIAAIAAALAGLKGTPIVLDPVMVATSGDVLLEPDAEDALVTQLIPRATIITPNLQEAARLLGCPPADDTQAMQDQAAALRNLGAENVLLTGGDLAGNQAVDVLASADGVERFEGRRVETSNAHGTGCTLSSAIAAHLARGLGLRDAVGEAKAFVTQALQAGDELSVGRGRGPLNHLKGRPSD